MVKHTKGPWIHKDGSIFTRDGYTHIADLEDYNPNSNNIDHAAIEAEINANGELLAAAPVLLEQRDELLKALQLIHVMAAEMIRTDNPDFKYQIEAEARAVIANATKEAASEN